MRCRQDRTRRLRIARPARRRGARPPRSSLPLRRRRPRIGSAMRSFAADPTVGDVVRWPILARLPGPLVPPRSDPAHRRPRRRRRGQTAFRRALRRSGRACGVPWRRPRDRAEVPRPRPGAARSRARAQPHPQPDHVRHPALRSRNPTPDAMDRRDAGPVGPTSPRLRAPRSDFEQLFFLVGEELVEAGNVPIGHFLELLLTAPDVVL